MMRKIIVVIPFILSACSSAPTVNGVKYEHDETLSTAGDSSIPAWAVGGELKPFVIKKDGKVYSVGITTGRDGDRPEALLRVSENSARANYSKFISNRTEFIFQNAESDAGLDSTQAKWIGSEASNLVTHSMAVEGQWYKRYATSTEDHGRRILIKCYSLVTLPESDLKQAVVSAMREGQSGHKLAPEFQDRVARQWDRFVEGNVAEKPDARKPATNDSEK